jgi:VWFA-related protein
MHSAARSLALPLSLIFTSLFAAPPAALAQSKREEPTVREEARVTLVEVPVNVVDSYGRSVERLTADDFEIYDDGKKQTITGFEILDQRKPIAPPSAGEPPIHPAAQRHFLLLFDLSFGTPKGIVNARRAARDFVVNRMKELDMAAVATYSIEQGVRLLVTFTRDRSQLAAAVDTLGLPALVDRSPDPLGFVLAPPTQSNAVGFSNTVAGGRSANTFDVVLEEALENMEVMRARSFRAIYRDRVHRLLESLAQMAVALDTVQGRKHVLYLSEGFDSRELSGSTQGGGAREAEWVIRGQSWKLDSDVRFGNAGLQDRMGKALALFNRSDCVIHTIDIGGLRAGSEITGTEQAVNGQDSLFYMAEETGGEFLKNANDLGTSFERLLDRTGLIYILAFQPVRVPENGKFHTLKVRVKSKNYRVSHRTGYYEAKSYASLTPIEKKLAASSALSSAVPKTDIPAWVLAAAFPAPGDAAHVPVIIEIPGDRLLSGHADPQMNVDLFVYAIDAKGETRDYLFQTLTLDLAKVSEALRQNGIKYYGELTLPPEEYTLRVFVRNNETGRFGVSVNHLSVPASASSDPFTLPPLFLDDDNWILVKGKVHTPKASSSEYPFAIAGESFVPAALADLVSGKETRVCLIAYNFGRASAELEYTGKVLGADGKTHGKVDLTLLRASDREGEGPRKALFRFRPSGLDPGRYALAVKVENRATGQSSESSFPFDVQ